jgi:hypothetical protein
MDEPVRTGRDGSCGPINGQVFVRFVLLAESLGVPPIGISTIATSSCMCMINVTSWPTCPSSSNINDKRHTFHHSDTSDTPKTYHFSWRDADTLSLLGIIRPAPKLPRAHPLPMSTFVHPQNPARQYWSIPWQDRLWSGQVSLKSRNPPMTQVTALPAIRNPFHSSYPTLYSLSLVYDIWLPPLSTRQLNPNQASYGYGCHVKKQECQQEGGKIAVAAAVASVTQMPSSFASCTISHPYHPLLCLQRFP